MIKKLLLTLAMFILTIYVVNYSFYGMTLANDITLILGVFGILVIFLVDVWFFKWLVKKEKNNKNEKSDANFTGTNVGF